MKKIFAAIIFFLASPLFLFAADTQSLIESLQEQIAALREKVTALTVSEFSHDLFRGQKNEDVRALQEFLASDVAIYPEGLVTGFFGSLTEKAVQRFQEKHGIVSFGTADTTGYGRVGPKTRAKINALIASDATTASASDATGTTPPPVEEEKTEEKITEEVPLPDSQQDAAATETVSESQAPALETAPEGVVEKPAPDIKSGTGSAASGFAVGFGTGSIHYKELGRLTETGGLYGGTAAGGKTDPSLFVANLSAAKGSACDPYDAVALPEAVGPKTICDFKDAKDYTFSQADLIRFHEKASSCYEGVILFRQNGLYGGIEPEDVTKEGHLTYRYWYDASGGSDFSTVCLVGKQKKVSPALASILHGLSAVLHAMQDQLKALAR